MELRCSLFLCLCLSLFSLSLCLSLSLSLSLSLPPPLPPPLSLSHTHIHTHSSLSLSLSLSFFPPPPFPFSHSHTHIHTHIALPTHPSPSRRGRGVCEQSRTKTAVPCSALITAPSPPFYLRPAVCLHLCLTWPSLPFSWLPPAHLPAGLPRFSPPSIHYLHLSKDVGTRPRITCILVSSFHEWRDGDTPPAPCTCSFWKFDLATEVYSVISGKRWTGSFWESCPKWR